MMLRQLPSDLLYRISKVGYQPLETYKKATK